MLKCDVTKSSAKIFEYVWINTESQLFDDTNKAPHRFLQDELDLAPSLLRPNRLIRNSCYSAERKLWPKLQFIPNKLPQKRVLFANTLDSIQMCYGDFFEI